MSRTRTVTRPAVETLPTPARHGDSECCAACASTRVTRLTMTLTDGTPVDFTSCHACEHKTWRRDGQRLELGTVLAKATKPRL